MAGQLPGMSFTSTTSFYDSAATMQGSAPYGTSLAPLAGEGGERHILSIMTSDNNWDSIAFHSTENLNQLAATWIQKRGMSPVFQTGLVKQMQQMVTMKLITASVDVVDLL